MSPHPPGEPSIPYGGVARFVRQVTHDIRNGLSAIDLEAAYLAELAASEPELAVEVCKLRGLVAEQAKLLRALSSQFQPVSLNPVEWGAAILAEELGERLKARFATEEAFMVESRVAAEIVSADLEALEAALAAILANSFAFRASDAPVHLRFFSTAEGRFGMEIRQSGAVPAAQAGPPSQWGLQPLRSTRPGGLGLGLYRTRQIVQAHGGEFQCELQEGELTTRLVIPREPVA